MWSLCNHITAEDYQVTIVAPPADITHSSLSLVELPGWLAGLPPPPPTLSFPPGGDNQMISSKTTLTDWLTDWPTLDTGHQDRMYLYIILRYYSQSWCLVLLLSSPLPPPVRPIIFFYEMINFPPNCRSSFGSPGRRNSSLIKTRVPDRERTLHSIEYTV